MRPAIPCVLFCVASLVACGGPGGTSGDAGGEPTDAAHADGGGNDAGSDAATDTTLDAAEDAPASMDGASADAARDAATDAHADAPADHPATPVTVRFQDGVSPTSAYAGTRDSYLSEASPTMNLGTSTTIWADGDVPAGSHATRQAVVRWDVSTIPVGSTVQSASIAFTVSTATNSGTTDNFLVYALLRGWTESEVSWNDAMTGAAWATPGASGLGVDRTVREIGSVGPVSSGATTATVNAMGLTQVQRWVDDPANNFGVIVTNLISDDGLGMASREDTPASARPKLTITYLPPQ